MFPCPSLRCSKLFSSVILFLFCFLCDRYVTETQERRGLCPKGSSGSASSPSGRQPPAGPYAETSLPPCSEWGFASPVPVLCSRSGSFVAGLGASPPAGVLCCRLRTAHCSKSMLVGVLRTLASSRWSKFTALGERWFWYSGVGGGPLWYVVFFRLLSAAPCSVGKGGIINSLVLESTPQCCEFWMG